MKQKRFQELENNQLKKYSYKCNIRNSLIRFLCRMFTTQN